MPVLRLVTLVALVDRLPTPPSSAARGRATPRLYPERLFLLCRYEHGLSLNTGLKAFLKAA